MTKSPTELVTVIKSVTANQICKEYPQVKKLLWGREFWTDGYFACSIGEVSPETIRRYIENQG